MSKHCAVCPSDDGLTGVVVAGREMLLCGEHAARLGDVRPESFDDLAAFFADLGTDRRVSPDRRRRERRMFPPRPELRRHDFGRRRDDPER